MNTGKYQEYPRYNQTDAKWLGQLPAHWDAIRCKYIYKEFGERSENGSETLLSVSEYYGIKPRSSVMDEGDFLSRAESLEGYKKCQVNDLVMNIMLAWKTGLGVTKYDGIVSPAYSVFRLISPCSPDYMNYLLRTPLYTTEFKTKSTGVIDSRLRLYPESFGTVEIIKPPLEEQERIANFLDHETTKIDTLIDKQQQLIKLLKEKRQAVISHAVTKGLNPDAPKKDSGVEWLGEVPEHWEVKKISHIAVLKSGDGITSEHIEIEGEYPVFGGNGLRGYSEEYNLDGDYVLIGRQGALCGNINYASGKFWVSEHAIVVYPQTKFQLKWLGETLRAMDLNQYSISAAQPGLSVANITCLKVPFPPQDETIAIANYIEKESRRIDLLVDEANKAISLMQERRTALISAAVTGKIDVRNWQPSKSDIAQENAA